MQPDTSTLLTSLLKQAQVDTIVTSRLTSFDPITVSQYLSAYVNRMRRYDPTQLPLGMMYKVKLVDGSTRDSLRSILSETLRDYTSNDRIQVPLVLPGSGPGDGFPLDDFVDKLVEISLLSSPEEATDAFFASLSDSRCQFREFVLLGGMSIVEPIRVFDGVKLLLLSNSSAELPPWLPPLGFSDVPINAFLGGTVLAMNRYVSPRYQVPDLRIDQPDQDVYTTASRDVPHFNANAFCACLSLACETGVQQSVWWQYTPQDEIAAMQGDGGRLTAYSVKSHSGSKTISHQDVQEAKRIYEALERLDIGVRRRLEIPLTRWIGSMDRKSLVDQAIDLGIALEALYANDGGTEISFRLRIRAAKHLREDVEEQRAVTEQINRVYRLRSMAVHEGELPAKNLKVAGQAVEHGDLLQLGRELCREGILKVVMEGHLPDWKSMALA